jgi:hypothetical protein
VPTEDAGLGLSDAELRRRAIDVLVRNHRDGYTVPAVGLYPFQWCWDSGPIALGWAAAGRWDDAWTELTRLMSAQWPSGMVPHIVFWHEDKSYFPGPEVWATGRTPPSSGITQPPLPVSAAARLFAADPDRERAVASLRSLWPGLMAWLSWIERARKGPHGAAVIVHPWESGMDNSPSWDQPLSVVPEVSNDHIERRDVATVSADQRPSQREYRQYLGIVDALRAAGWDTERQPADTPFSVEDPGFTAIAARAATDLASVAAGAGLDGREPARLAESMRAGLEALWDDDLGWYRPYDIARQMSGWSGDLDRLGSNMGRHTRRTCSPHDGASRPLATFGARLDPDRATGRPLLRPHSLLARAGVGARQLARRRRPSSCGLHRASRLGTLRHACSRRAELLGVLRPSQLGRHRRTVLLMERRAHSGLAHRE